MIIISHSIQQLNYKIKKYNILQSFTFLLKYVINSLTLTLDTILNQETIMKILHASTISSVVALLLVYLTSLTFATSLLISTLSILTLDNLAANFKKSPKKTLLVTLLTAGSIYFFIWYFGFSYIFLLFNNNILFLTSFINLILFAAVKLTSLDFYQSIKNSIMCSIKRIVQALITPIYAITQVIDDNGAICLAALCITLICAIAAFFVYIQEDVLYVLIMSISDFYSALDFFAHMLYYFIKIIAIAAPYAALATISIIGLIFIVNNLIQTYKNLKHYDFSNIKLLFILSSLILSYFGAVIFQLSLSSTLTIPNLIGAITASFHSLPLILSILGIWILINFWNFFYTNNHNPLPIDQKIFQSFNQTIAFLLSIVDSALLNIPSILIFGKAKIATIKDINSYFLPASITRNFATTTTFANGLIKDHFKKAATNLFNNYGAFYIKTKADFKTLVQNENITIHDDLSFSLNQEFTLRYQDKYKCPLSQEDISLTTAAYTHSNDIKEEEEEELLPYTQTVTTIDSYGNIVLFDKDHWQQYKKNKNDVITYQIEDYICLNLTNNLPIIYETETTQEISNLLINNNLETLLHKRTNNTNDSIIKLIFVTGFALGAILAEIYSLNILLTAVSIAIIASTITSILYQRIQERSFTSIFKPLAASAIMSAIVFFIITTNPALAMLTPPNSLLIPTILAAYSILLSICNSTFNNKESFATQLKKAIWDNRLKPMLKQLYNIVYLTSIGVIICAILALVNLIIPSIAWGVLLIIYNVYMSIIASLYKLSQICLLLYNVFYYNIIPIIAILLIGQAIYYNKEIFQAIKLYTQTISQAFMLNDTNILYTMISSIIIAAYVINPTNSFIVLLNNISLSLTTLSGLSTIILISIGLLLLINAYNNDTTDNSIIEKIISSILTTADLLFCTLLYPLILVTPVYLQQTIFYMLCAIRSILFGQKDFKIYNQEIDITELQSTNNLYKEGHDYTNKLLEIIYQEAEAKPSGHKIV